MWFPTKPEKGKTFYRVLFDNWNHYESKAFLKLGPGKESSYGGYCSYQQETHNPPNMYIEIPKKLKRQFFPVSGFYN